MKTGYFNIFVDKLLKKKGKLLKSEEVEKIGQHIMGENYTRAKLYKLVHQAKNRTHILSLKKDLYYIPSQDEEENDIINKFYREILSTHIKTYIDNKGLLTGSTALQLLLQNYEIPDVILVISANKQCVEVVVRDKKIAIKKMNVGKDSLFTTLKKSAQKVTIRKKSFLMTSLIVSLMETLYASGDNDTVTNELVKKVLRKYWKSLDWNELIMLLRKGKYHSSLNKLHKLARGINDDYANHIMEIIKRYSYRIG